MSGSAVALITAIISAVLTGSLFSFMQFLIARRDARKEDSAGIKKELAEIKEELQYVKKDTTRTQMLILMSDNRPQDEHEILNLAEYYFDTLNANFYMTSVFGRWLEENHIIIPGWWKGEKQDGREKS